MRVVFESVGNERYDLFDFNANSAIRVGMAIWNNKVFRIVSLQGVQNFIHELGHAAAYEMMTGGNATIHMYTDFGGGSVTSEGGRRLSKLGSTWFSFSGPLASVLASLTLIVGIFALTHYVPMPFPLNTSLRVVICLCAGINLLKEFVYAIASGYSRDHGDWGQIVNEGGKLHYIVALTVLIALCALAAYGVVVMI